MVSALELVLAATVYPWLYESVIPLLYSVSSALIVGSSGTGGRRWCDERMSDETNQSRYTRQ